MSNAPEDYDVLNFVCAVVDSLQTWRPFQMVRKMKVSMCIVGMCLFGHMLHAEELNVRLVNPPEEGTVVFVLFDSANTFGDFRDSAYERRLPLDGRKVYRLDDVNSGEYALMVFYDENGKNRIDKNL